MYIKVKKDRYYQKRGGYHKIYNLLCPDCDNVAFVYQKDGKGALKRLYYDRIHTSHVVKVKDNIVHCANCQKMLGYDYIYPEESRPAIKLFVGSLLKRLRKDI